MSLLKWKKLAKQKTELGNKINFVHDTILKNQLGEKTSQESFQKAFKPITTKLDDVVFRNLNIPRLTKKRGKKLGVPDYGIALEDEDIPDYGLDDFFDEGLVPTVAQKCHGNFNLVTAISTSLTAISIWSRLFQLRSRQFQFGHGNFNFTHGNFNLVSAISTSLTAISIWSRQFQFDHGNFNFTHGNLNFVPGNFFHPF